MPRLDRWALVLACAVAASAQSGKVVRIEDREVWVGTRRLTASGVEKSFPRWSPDGARIVYLEGSWNPATRPLKFDIRVLTADGKLARSIPFVDDSARYVYALDWVSPGSVGVEVNYNPSNNSLAVFDVATGKSLFGDLGFGFTACHGTGEVAYLSHVPHFCHPDCPKHDLMLWRPGGKARVLAQGFSGVEDVASFTWSADCQTLKADRQGKAPAYFPRAPGGFRPAAVRRHLPAQCDTFPFHAGLPPCAKE